MRLIVEEDHLSISAGDESVTLIKIHGDFNYPNKMVITEEDYDSYISSNPMLATYLTNFLITRTPLFIGYSLEDYDFRIIWQIVKNRLGSLKRPAYILKVNANNLEISRYKRRGVHVINIPGNQKDYAVIFQQLFSELRDYWNEQEIQNIKPTKEDVNIQLIKPKDSNSNLCFIVSSIKNISLYKKYIYPILQNYGIIPTTGDEIISVGDNWTAKVMSVISKADYFIVDSTSNNAAYELSLILKRNDINRDHIFIIGSNENIKDNDRVNYILNNSDPIYEIEEISNKIESWAEKISEKNEYQISEAERLYKIKEYRPAFISAFNDMEGKLRKLFSNMLAIENNKKYLSFNNIPLRELFENAIEKELISISSNDIMKMIRTRNLAIHENCDVTYHDAKKAIELNKELSEAIIKIYSTNEEKNA
jgi:hypothetical protein